MKAIAVVLIAATLLMGACSESDDNFGASSEPVRQVDPIDNYLDFMRERVEGASSKTDGELIDGGQRLCGELEGKTTDQLAVVARLLGLNMQEFADTLIASINTFCPRYDYLLET